MYCRKQKKSNRKSLQLFSYIQIDRPCWTVRNLPLTRRVETDPQKTSMDTGRRDGNVNPSSLRIKKTLKLRMNIELEWRGSDRLERRG